MAELRIVVCIYSATGEGERAGLKWVKINAQSTFTETTLYKFLNISYEYDSRVTLTLC